MQLTIPCTIVAAGAHRFGVAHASGVSGDGVLAIANFPRRDATTEIVFKKNCFGATAKPARETRALPRRLDAWEQECRFADNMSVRQFPPLRVCK